MAMNQGIETLGGWEGYRIQKIETPQDKELLENERRIVSVERAPTSGILRRCNGCGRMPEREKKSQATF